MKDDSPSNGNDGLPVIPVGDIQEELNPRRWLVQDLWGASAAGFIGGAPKSYKSFLGLDLAVSVASGTDCLGRYPVVEPGPTLVYLAEDSLQTVRERVAALTQHRRLDINTLPVHVITAPRLRLDQPDDRERLAETARRLKPRLLLLDPLVRLHGIDENNATEVAQLLSCLRDLQRRFDMAVIIVHHTRKTLGGAQAGQNLRGSTDLHAFGDSNLYVRRVRQDLVLSMEHRAAQAPQPMNMSLATADAATIHLEVTKIQAPEEQHPSLLQAILKILSAHTAINGHDLRKQLCVKNERLGQALRELEALGHIERTRGGWRLRKNS
jgi:RecA-family ATPase